MLEWIRFLAGAALLVCGLGIFTVELIGVYRFKYVLNGYGRYPGDRLLSDGADPYEWV